ncbi:predicted protein [Nematostella vectensis]|uniref:Uncharacterized protein n=1 Tax=Nematostella vectensis TaxID=45351 RepID=A7RP09_NEMVE|nr:predicted protein [Nematostella vectensis]|eukprot:XP_001638895.1 predicted protein [Nematostella vectensis]
MAIVMDPKDYDYDAPIQYINKKRFNFGLCEVPLYWANILFAFLAVAGQVGQNVSLPLWLVATKEFSTPSGNHTTLHATDTTGEMDAYFVVSFASMCFVVIFGIAILVMRFAKPGMIGETERMFPHTILFGVGLCDALNGSLVVFASPPSRTAPYLQAILGNFIIPLTIVLRFFVLRKKPTILKFVCGMLVLLALFICLLPSIFPKQLDPSPKGAGEGASGLAGVLWPICFMLGFVIMESKEHPRRSMSVGYIRNYTESEAQKEGGKDPWALVLCAERKLGKGVQQKIKGGDPGSAPSALTYVTRSALTYVTQNVLIYDTQGALTYVTRSAMTYVTQGALTYVTRSAMTYVTQSALTFVTQSALTHFTQNALTYVTQNALSKTYCLERRVPAAAMNVIEEKGLKMQNIMSRKGINIVYFLFWESVYQLLCVLALFWVDIIPSYGFANSISQFWKNWSFGFRCFFGGAGCNGVPGTRGTVFVVMYTISYIGGGFLLRYAEGATLLAIVTSLVTPLGFIFWTLFDSSPFKWHPVGHVSTWYALGALGLMVPAIFFYNFGSPEVERELRVREAVDPPYEYRPDSPGLRANETDPLIRT